jgi:dTDP-4-dehydrorhamnose 3,5-epimerase
MSGFLFEDTKLKGAYLITPFYCEDQRGFFLKDFEKEIYALKGIRFDLSESFETYSGKNVLRGLHFQTEEPQAKLVRAITGKIFDVIVDLRQGSDTFGNWQGFILSETNRKTIYIPRGFAHGFFVHSDSAIVSYKCAGEYHKGSDSGIVWNDKELSVDWGVQNAIVSEKDRGLMSFQEFKLNYHALL